jgi:hypothetical protein
MNLLKDLLDLRITNYFKDRSLAALSTANNNIQGGKGVREVRL